MVYAYIGGSGKKLNQEIIGPTFVHSILDCNFRIGLERYIFEVSSEQKSKDALQLFVDGIADWDAKEPTVREQMVHDVRAVFDAARRNQQAAQRRLSRLDGPADERRRQSSGDGGHGGSELVDLDCKPTRKRSASWENCTVTMPSKAKRNC